MSDPKRWLDDPESAPDGAPELLRQGEKKPPALSNAVKAASAVALANAAIGTASASLGVTAKVIALVLVVGAGGGAAVVARRMSDSNAVANDERRSSNAAESRRVVSRAQPVLLPAMPPAIPPVEVVEPAPPAASEQSVAATTDEARVAPTRPRTPTPPRAEPIAPPVIAAAVEAPVSLVEEATLLEQARGALRADPARALSIVETHARRYPNASLRAETELIAVDALVRLGRYDEARARGEAALRSDQRGLYSSRIQRILERANEP